ncbi:Blue-light-activated protein [Candidatus Nitrosocosmicus oleophilus]|jgi:DNA-binding response OmpR family regulator|uniref:Blue-light-activated protein n=1 Tax=Candidatus Nitrosocosmicus oleophilus TaxID=1353260 RepID=A0A654LVA4_9ARCH|nr:response regulator [Candidatus Nitrosocosmicus oleophilus]ALI34309.1 Blue-light-activated protein [Candidatus Nitrosocosmicus oleophilus]
MSLPHSVMVVDDEPEIANLYEEFLRKSGFISTCFIDPLLALEHYNQNPNRYSLIITDLCMPSLDGIRFAKRIREFDTKIKILLNTAFYFNEMPDTEEYREAKLTGLIQKPTRLSELRQRIIELLSK